MKKIIYIFSLFITVIGLLGSCINLESESYDSINTTIFPTNADDADALVIAAAYGPFRADGYSGLFQCAKGGLASNTAGHHESPHLQSNRSVDISVLEAKPPLAH